MKIHLAARYTFANDGRAACYRIEGHSVTHVLALVTCKSCLKTKEFKRAERLGLKDNDRHWNGTNEESE